VFIEELVRAIRQIAPSHGGDRINHLPKFGLGLLDLLKRVSECLLCPPSLLDVGAGCVPANHLAVFVQQWAVADEEPPVLAVFPKRPLFVFEWNGDGKTVLPPFSKPLHILLMEYAIPKIVGPHFVQRQPCVLKRPRGLHKWLYHPDLER